MEFEATYEVDDGYAGSNRPQYFNVEDYELYEDMDDDEIKEIFFSLMQEDFQMSVSPYATNLDEFVEWAKERIKNMENK